MRYPKINTLWKRDLSKPHKPIIEGEYSDPEFAYVNAWHVEEKAEGMHIRLYYEQTDGRLRYLWQGRTAESLLPIEVKEFLGKFSREQLMEALGDDGNLNLTLHMEIIGPKIQGNYYHLPELQLVLFDVQSNGLWAGREEAYALAKELGLITPWVYGQLTEPEIIDIVKSRLFTNYSKDLIHIEGVVCRGEAWKDGVFLGNKIMKLKCKDYSHGA